jgi:plastocyanin
LQPVGLKPDYTVFKSQVINSHCLRHISFLNCFLNLKNKIMKKISAFSLLALLYIDVSAATQTVTVQNHVFTPASFTINQGDTVKWVWLSGSHTTTSVTIPAGAAAWNNNITSASTTFLYVPAVAGNYSYKCIPHASMGMVASFTVTCPAVNSHIQSNGATTFCSGGSVILQYNGNGATTFQWKKNGNIINGATASSYAAASSGSYNLAASNTCESVKTSNSINVTVNPLPSATVNPTDTVYICPGDSIKLQANVNTSLTYQWLKSGVAINGATASSYYAKQTANYKVRVTKTATGCTKTSALTRVVVSCREGNIGAKLSGISIYPSPSSDAFYISIPSYAGEKYHASVYDEKGDLIKSFDIQDAMTTFGSELANGIYIIEILNGGNLSERMKIIKQK